MKTALFAPILTALWIGIISLTHAQVPQIINYQGRVAVGAPPVNFDGTGQFKFAFVNGGGAGVAATASVTVLSGRVTAISVISGGFGYLTPPVVTVSGIGSGATATASVLNGAVTSITVTSQGSGYIFGTFVSVAPPPPPVYTTYWSNDGTGFLGQAPTAAVSLAVSKGLYSVLLGDTTLANMTAISPAVFGNPDVRLRVWFDDGVNGFQLLSPDQRIAAVGYALMSASVPAGAIGATQLAEGAVTSAKLAAGAVGSSQLAAGAVGSTQLAAGAVTSAQLAANAVQSINIANGAIGSTKLATNAVQSTNIAAGAVGSTQIAAGAIGFSSLAKPPQSGTVLSTQLFHDFGGSSFTVNFPQSYASTPVVALSLSASSTAFPSAVTAQVTRSSALLFDGKVATFAHSPIAADPAPGVGIYTSLAVVNGNPAMSYFDYVDGDLKFVRATKADGTGWDAPVTLDSGAGRFCSLAVVSNHPAIAYYDSNFDDLKYVRATDPTGAIWGTPVTVDSTGNVGQTPSLVVVDGNPAIAYYDSTNGGLKYVRAGDATGTAWGDFATPDSEGTVGSYASMAVVDGNPAISYFDNTNTTLKYVRATNSTGSSWGTPLTIAAVTFYTPRSSLAVVDRHPAISYSSGHLKYVRATDTDGTAWGVAVTLDSTGLFTGNYNSLAVVHGHPAIGYFDAEHPNGVAGILRYVRATNASGTAWAPPITLDTTSGTHCSLAVVNGKPAVGYRSDKLDFITANPPSPFQVNWIALPP